MALSRYHVAQLSIATLLSLELSKHYQVDKLQRSLMFALPTTISHTAVTHPLTPQSVYYWMVMLLENLMINPTHIVVCSNLWACQLFGMSAIFPHDSEILYTDTHPTRIYCA